MVRRQPLHRLPRVIADVGLRESTGRKSKRNGEHDQRRYAAGGDERGLHATGTPGTEPTGEPAQADGGKHADRQVERIEQAPLDVGEVGQVQEGGNQRWPGEHQREGAIPSPPGDGNADTGEE